MTEEFALPEKGEFVTAFGDPILAHQDILTVSQPDGRARIDDVGHTCQNVFFLGRPRNGEAYDGPLRDQSSSKYHIDKSDTAF